MVVSRASVLVFVVAGRLLSAVTVSAQIPDEFTNLQVLPKDIGKRELVNLMREYAGALGVRCQFCHVAEDPNSLQGTDFASDDNKHKGIARVMMRMTQEINDKLLPQTGSTDFHRVSCVTCHHGVKEPETLTEILLEKIEDDGLEAAQARYRELRNEYYGIGAYNFGPQTLLDVAETLARDQSDVQGAMELVKLNLEFNPDTANSYLMLGQLQSMAGDKEAAIRSLERCLELEPDSRRAKQMLERVRSSD